MERGISDKNILEKFTVDFCRIVDRHCPYIIVSGFVAIALGRTRSTEDIDMILPKLTLQKFLSLHEDLYSHGFSCIQSEDAKEMYEYLAERLSIRYTWKDTPLPEMEVKFAKDALDEEQLLSRKKIPDTGLDIWFSPIETNIAFKEEYLKSDKDMEDARHLRLMFEGELDEKAIGSIKARIRKLRL